jgi:hypothetical protein
MWSIRRLKMKNRAKKKKLNIPDMPIGAQDAMMPDMMGDPTQQDPMAMLMAMMAAGAGGDAEGVEKGVKSSKGEEMTERKAKKAFKKKKK